LCSPREGSGKSLEGSAGGFFVRGPIIPSNSHPTPLKFKYKSLGRTAALGGSLRRPGTGTEDPLAPGRPGRRPEPPVPAGPAIKSFPRPGRRSRGSLSRLPPGKYRRLMHLESALKSSLELVAQVSRLGIYAAAPGRPLAGHGGLPHQHFS